MGTGDESRLEGGRGEEHAARESGAMPAREECRVRAFGIGEVSHRTSREIRPPERAGVARGQRNRVAARGVPYTRHEPCGSPLERLVETRALGLAERCETVRHRP